MRKNTIVHEIRKQAKKRQRESVQNLKQTKKPARFKYLLSSWKIRFTFALSALLTVILIIPTLLVVPYMSDGDSQANAVSHHAGGEVELAMGSGEEKEPSVKVDVMRSSTEAIESVPLETYVARVVASETPAEFDKEALKAQALAARTFIVNRLLYEENSGEADVTDTTTDQVYHDEKELRDTMGSNFDAEMTKIKKAVSETTGEILTYDGEPITAAYFSTSNGYTENSEDYWDEKMPYLRSVESPWDKDTEKFMDQEVFTLAEVEKRLDTDLPAIDNLSMDISRTEGKRVDELTIGDETYSGRSVRKALDLASSDFTIDKKKDHLIVTTKGFGHGIGMSQFGANGMAEEGKSYEEIVKHYYQDVEISTMSDATPALAAKPS